MREPVSTVTNLAYVLAGAYAAFSGEWLYGATLVFLGIASGGYHATLSGHWQAADECAMYVTLCALSTLYGVPVFAALLMAVALCLSWASVSSFTVVPVLVAVNVVLVGFQNIGMAAVLALLAVCAYAIRQYAVWRGGTIEDIGHGIWHVLTAAALYIAAHA